MNDIEHLLSQKTKEPELSSEMKNRLYTRVLEKEEAMQSNSLRQRVRMWFVVPVLSIGALGAVAFASVFFFGQYQRAAYLAKIEHIYITPDENTNTAQPSTSIVALNGIGNISVANYLGGLGGGGPLDMSAWTLNSTVATAAFPSHVSVPDKHVFSESELREAMASLEFVPTQVAQMKTVNGVRALQSSNLSSLDCLAQIYPETTDTVPSATPCAVFSTAGTVVVFSAQAHTGGDPLQSFYDDVKKIQGARITSWKVLQNIGTAPDQGISEYIIQPTVVTGDVPELLPVWRVIVQNNVLVGYVGVLAPSESTNDTQVISFDDALSRIRDFMKTGDSTYGVALLSDVDPEQQGALNCDDAQLESAYVYDSEVHTLTPVPIYRVSCTMDNGTAVQWVVSAEAKAFTSVFQYILVDSLHTL